MRNIVVLFSILISFSFIVRADNLAFFKVSYDGRELTNGEKIVVKDYTDVDGKYTYMPSFIVENVTDRELLVYGGMHYTGTPSASMVKDNRDYWGRPQFCMSYCFSNGDDERVGYGVEYLSDKILCMPEVVMCDASAVSTYVLRIVPCVGMPGEGNYNEIEIGAFEITIVYSHDSGIDAVDLNQCEEKDIQDVEYYDLNGRQSRKPGKGIHIKRINGSGIKIMSQVP